MASWDTLALQHPHAHILQTPAWGRLKAQFGWEAVTLTHGEHGALVLFRRLPLGLTVGYLPRGPLANWNQRASLQALMGEVDQACRTRRAIYLKWEPDLPDTPDWAKLPEELGFERSAHTVQPPRTLIIDLTGSEAEILARMKPKTRYNIGLARKKEVTVRMTESPDNIQAFVELMKETGERDGFGTHSAEYYRQAYALFQPAGQCALVLTEHAGVPLAGVMVFCLGQRAWYLYGASSNRERPRMAPYLAQWEAMRWAKAQGALSYDLWGVPDETEDTLETEFETRHDGLWGVYRFKRGWGGRLVRTIGAWDKVYRPWLYRAYRLYWQLRRTQAEG